MMNQSKEVRKINTEQMLLELEDAVKEMNLYQGGMTEQELFLHRFYSLVGFSDGDGESERGIFEISVKVKFLVGHLDGFEYENAQQKLDEQN